MNNITSRTCVTPGILLAVGGRCFVTQEQRYGYRWLSGYGHSLFENLAHLFDRRRRAGLNGRPWLNNQGTGAAWNPRLQIEVASGGLRHSTAALSGPPTPPTPPTPLRDTDRSGEAGQTAKQAGPKARAGAEGIAQGQQP